MVRSAEGKRPEYFEAILQLRNVGDEVYEFAKHDLKKGGVYISKEMDVVNGKDIYISDNNYGRALGKRLLKEFGGECVVTASLYGQHDGKEIYRLTILFRGVDFKKGDIVEYKAEPYVVKVMGKEVMLQHAKNGEKVHVKLKDIGLIKIRKEEAED